MDAATQDPISVWQEVNTFECPHGQGVISPEACAELLRRRDLSQAHGITPQGKERAYRPKSCARCTEYQAHWDDVARRRAEAGQGQPKPKGEAMPTYIDCLACGKQDVPNTARGLCSTCYPQIPTKKRENYDLEKAKEKRRKRLSGEEVRESTPNPGDGLQLEPSEPEGDVPGLDPGSYGNSLKMSRFEVADNDPNSSNTDPLAGFEFIPCDNSCIYSQEASVDPHGKFLRIGRKAAKVAGLQPETYVHLYRGSKGLALKVLREPDSRSYKLSQDGGPKRTENCKVTLSAKKLVKSGAVYPGQRFKVRPHESGRIVYLDAIEESASV